MKQIIIEGVSGSGKSTLYRAVDEATNFEHLLIHRHTPSQYVYNTIYKRKVDLKELQRIERVFQRLMPTLVVWLMAEPEVAEQRKREMNDPHIEDTRQAHSYFYLYMTQYCQYQNKIFIDTTNAKVEECVKQVLLALEKTEAAPMTPQSK
jgi:thymidylate kinase